MQPLILRFGEIFPYFPLENYYVSAQIRAPQNPAFSDILR